MTNLTIWGHKVDSKDICHIIMDLETFSTKPNAVIAEVAYLVLDAQFNKIQEASMLVDNPFANSGASELATIRWHETNTNLLDRLEDTSISKYGILAVLGHIKDLFSKVNPDTILWCHGKDFDIPVLRLTAIAYNMDFQFPNYRKVECLRTTMHVAETLGWKPLVITKSHSALQDCIDQAKQLVSLTDWLTKTKHFADAYKQEYL